MLRGGGLHEQQPLVDIEPRHDAIPVNDLCEIVEGLVQGV